MTTARCLHAGGTQSPRGPVRSCGLPRRPWPRHRAQTARAPVPQWLEVLASRQSNLTALRNGILGHPLHRLNKGEPLSVTGLQARGTEQSAQRWRCSCQPYAPAGRLSLTGRSVVPCCFVLSGPWGHDATEGVGHLNNPVTWTGTNPATVPPPPGRDCSKEAAVACLKYCRSSLWLK
jgi:hypothetical protein